MSQQASESVQVADPPPAASWWALAACRSVDPELFFPVSAGGRWAKQVREAKAVCAGCRVRPECLAFAIGTHQMHGIWGGMTEEERYREFSARRRVSPGDAVLPRDAVLPGEAVLPGGAVRRGAGARAGVGGPGELIRKQAGIARLACDRMTGPAFKGLADSVERAALLPAKPGWERRAAAHADLFRLLAMVARSTAAGGAAVRHAPAAGVDDGVRVMRELIRGAGPAANGMITSSHRRLLVHLRARDPEAAAAEIESHLKALHMMWLLASYSRGARTGPLTSAR